MKVLRLRYMLGVAALVLLTTLMVSSEAMGQGRGRGRGGWGSDKKCAKFVNCHDARDGRWDGRGPNRRVRFTSRFFRRNRRDRDFDRARWRRNRDFDRDRFRHRRR